MTNEVIRQVVIEATIRIKGDEALGKIREQARKWNGELEKTKRNEKSVTNEVKKLRGETDKLRSSERRLGDEVNKVAKSQKDVSREFVTGSVRAGQSIDTLTRKEKALTSQIRQRGDAIKKVAAQTAAAAKIVAAQAAAGGGGVVAAAAAGGAVAAGKGKAAAKGGGAVEAALAGGAAGGAAGIGGAAAAGKGGILAKIAGSRLVGAAAKGGGLAAGIALIPTVFEGLSGAIDQVGTFFNEAGEARDIFTRSATGLQESSLKFFDARQKQLRSRDPVQRFLGGIGAGAPFLNPALGGAFISGFEETRKRVQ